MCGSLLTSTLQCFKYGYLTHYISVNRNVPTLSRFALEWTFFLLCREASFYYSHRLLHHPLFYAKIHKQHHEWQTPIALSALYCHPIEHVASNILPAIVGPVLMNSHTLVMHLWLLYVITLSLNHHSGYHFPLVPFSPIFHDFHHLKYIFNISMIAGILTFNLKIQTN